MKGRDLPKNDLGSSLNPPNSLEIRSRKKSSFKASTRSLGDLPERIYEPGDMEIHRGRIKSFFRNMRNKSEGNDYSRYKISPAKFTAI